MDVADSWSRRWTAVAGACLLASFFACLFSTPFTRFPSIWAWSEGWSGEWVPGHPRSWRERGNTQHPPKTWRAFAPWLMVVPVLLLARLRSGLWRGRLLLAMVMGYLFSVCIPSFGWIELPRGAHDGNGWGIILRGWLVVLSSACVAAGAHVARRYPSRRRGWLMGGAGGIVLLCALLLPIGEVPWVITATAHPEHHIGVHVLYGDLASAVFDAHRRGPATWVLQREILGGWVVSFGLLGLLMLIVRRRWSAILVRLTGTLFLLAYPLSGVVAYRLAPLYVVTGSHSPPGSLGWWSLIVGSMGHGLMAAGQFILAAVAVGTVAVTGLAPAPEPAMEASTDAT